MLDDAYATPFLSRGREREQPVASSSKLTLDSFLGVDPHSDRHSALHPHEDLEAEDGDTSFAADEDLLAALSPSASSPLLTPSAAYRALRQSPLFSQHLLSLLPRLGPIYASLRTDGSGVHNLLVSDLLLRNPSPAALRAILIDEATHFPAHPEDALRQGLIVQAYRALIPSLRRRALAPLTPSALGVVARALMAEGHAHLDTLDHVYYQLAHAANWTREDGWPALAILLHLTKHGRAEHALKLLQYPVSLGKLPAAMGRTSASHSEPATLMAQSAVVRCALYWGLDARAQSAVTDLVTTMSRTAVSGPALELVLTAIRGASARRRPSDIEWAGRTLLALAADEGFPPLPNIDLYYSALSPSAALAFYEAMPENRAAPPSPHHILRMALTRPSKPTLRRLATDLARAPHAAPAVPGILRALAAARMLGLVQRMYAAWRGANVLDSGTTLAMVRALTRGARSAKNTALAREVLADYMQNAPGGRAEKASVALHAYALIGAEHAERAVERSEAASEARSGAKATKASTEANEANDNAATASEPASPSPTPAQAQADPTALLTHLITTRGPSHAQSRLAALATSHPSLAHRLAEIARAHGLEPPRPAVVLAARCATGHWGALAAAGGRGAPKVPLTRVEEGCVAALRKARQGRLNVAVGLFGGAVEADAVASGGGGVRRDDADADAVIPPTASALLHRCTALHRWDAGLSVLTTALSVSGDEGLVDAAAVFISALGRGEAKEAKEAYAAHVQEVQRAVGRLEGASRVLLESMLERAAARLGAAGEGDAGSEAVVVGEGQRGEGAVGEVEKQK